MVSSQERGRTAQRESWHIAAQYFQGWRDGTPGALEGLVRLLSPILWHVARAYRLDQRLAEDAVQNAWIALLRNADSIRDPQVVIAWMTVTTRREAGRLARQESRERPTDPEDVHATMAPEAGHEGTVLDDVTAALLWRHVRALSDRCQQLLRIVAFEEKPNYTAISANAGIPVGSIGPTRRRCLEKLRDLLAADPEWSDW